jgi:hypothetical protein
MRRVPATEIEAPVIRSVREHLKRPIDDRIQFNGLCLDGFSPICS